VSSRSILFKAEPFDGVLTISVGGVTIPYFALSTGPNYTVFGGDISVFAGQTKELSPSVLQNPGETHGNWIIDNIQFSDLAVPEPTRTSFFALAALILVCRFARQGRRKPLPDREGRNCKQLKRYIGVKPMYSYIDAHK